MPVSCRFAPAASPGYASAPALVWTSSCALHCRALPDHRHRAPSPLSVFPGLARKTLPEPVCAWGKHLAHSTRRRFTARRPHACTHTLPSPHSLPTHILPSSCDIPVHTCMHAKTKLSSIHSRAFMHTTCARVLHYFAHIIRPVGPALR